ncbi:MAG TPA: leucyl/phenylalanyl-tRNA--protein transferase [Xanthobacteraceae bacterium]|nr:leucyl/phenylalanyl-tRNA--protein transferase [Xanthobacteraceae bacterium]
MNSPSIVPPIPDAAARREALFRETPRDIAERIALGLAWAMHPKRVRAIPAVARVWLRDLFGGRGLPDPRTAGEGGIAGIAHDLSVNTLLAAYKHTLYPWGHVGPLKWLSTDERCVLFFDELHIAKRLRRQMRQNEYRVTFDTDFEGVMRACAERRPGRWHLTWLRPKIMRAFANLYDAGHAHSFEVWNKDGALVGGGYGLAVNGVFFTESQFSRESNTSKMGFTLFNWHLAKWGFALNDGKDPTPTIDGMNFRMIPRAQLQATLDRGSMETCRVGRWQCETDLKSIAEWKPEEEAAPIS